DLDGVDGVTGDSVTVTSGGLTIEDVVDAEGGLTASGPVWLKGDSSTNYVAGDIKGDGVKFSASAVDVELDGAGDQTIDAGTGQLTATGTITKTGTGDLTLHSGSGGLAINLADAVTAALGNLWISADNGDIQLGGDLMSNTDGVSVVSENGRIYTDDGSGKLNVTVIGNSDGGGGVDLRNGGKAAIVIMSKGDLELGANAVLIAQGTYNAGSVDDRGAVYFRNSDEHSGEPIDVAVYLASTGGDVHLGGYVNVQSGGTAVVDAYENVFFEDDMEVDMDRLEACSRVTQSLSDAIGRGSLPYADLADEEGIMDDLDWIEGTYVLRGGHSVRAWVLNGQFEIPFIPIEDLVEASSVEAPPSPELAEIGEIQGAAFDNMRWLAQELGLCEGDETGEDASRCQEITQAYLAGAFLQATDMRPHRAAVQLRNLVQVLHDEGGTRIAALSRVVGEFVESPGPPSDEQMAAIATAFAAHANDGTHYATAGQWLDALAEYTAILATEIGWSADESVAFVMGKYATVLTETGDVATTAFIQMHLEALGG
ncbi:MAG: hypothetical protein ACYSTF_02085, partial [Planctomycetota bacterium]